MKPNADKCKQYILERKSSLQHTDIKKPLQKSTEKQQSENHYVHIYSWYYYHLWHLEATVTNKGKVIVVPNSQIL